MPSNGHDLTPRLRDQLSPKARDALDRTLALAGETPVYLVGGSVRDLLLGGSHLDLDLVLEGDAVALAGHAGEALSARVVTHPRFGTAVVSGPGFRLDLARARAETYERPGALPAVRPASLVDDLARRDFTINAIALRLNGPEAGTLIDPHGGRRDLRERLVRALHEASFRDDATRMLRACRYAARFDFEIERETLASLQRDLSYLDTISGARLRHEFERIAQEERASAALTVAEANGVLRAAHPALALGPRTRDALLRLRDATPSHRDAVLFCALLRDAPERDVERVIDRLALTGRQASAARGFVALRDDRRLGTASLRTSDAARLLSSQPVAAVEALSLLADDKKVAERARQYLDRWRYLRPRLNGRDLEALGIPHGPRVGEALTRLHDARLDGETASRAEEVELLRNEGFLREPVEARHG